VTKHSPVVTKHSPVVTKHSPVVIKQFITGPVIGCGFVLLG
jgi:hypothetical protein